MGEVKEGLEGKKEVVGREVDLGGSTEDGEKEVAEGGVKGGGAEGDGAERGERRDCRARGGPCQDSQVGSEGKVGSGEPRGRRAS